jgi:hypothetical protein
LTCKVAHGAMPLVAIGLVVDANSLPPIFLIIQFESRAISGGDEFCWGIAWQASQLAPGILLEERNIFIFKLHCLLGTISRTLYPVFSNPKAIVERNHGKVRRCLLLRGLSQLLCCFDKEFWDIGLDGKLFPSGRIPLFISIQHNRSQGRRHSDPTTFVGFESQASAIVWSIAVSVLLTVQFLTWFPLP